MDDATLRALNIEIGQRESELDGAWFERHLAPAFSMRRASPMREVIDRRAFLASLSNAPKKSRATRIEAIWLLGTERAVVTCVVTMDGNQYDNLRVFVRNSARGEMDPPWLLLAWANEPRSG